MVSNGQLALLAVAVALLGGAMVIAWWRLLHPQAERRLLLRGLMAGGVAISAAVLAWHASTRGNWMPLGDNFQTLVWLGLLLGLFVLYLQMFRPLPGIEAFVLPVVVAMLVGAGVFGKARPHDYVTETWTWVHHVTAYMSAVAFAVAFAVAAMYLLANRRLRRKQPINGPELGSLERLEHLTLTSVTLGFAMLTVGLLTGLIMIAHKGWNAAMTQALFSEPKIWLGVLVWLVYAVVLHAPINPRFRGRKAAMLSVLGFLLMISTLIAVQYMSEA